MECLLDAGHSGELRLESIKFSAAKLGWQLNAVWLFNKEHLAGFLQWLISDRFKPTDDCWVNSFFNVFCFMKASRPLGYGDEKKPPGILLHMVIQHVPTFWIFTDDFWKMPVLSIIFWGWKHSLTGHVPNLPQQSRHTTTFLVKPAEVGNPVTEKSTMRCLFFKRKHMMQVYLDIYIYVYGCFRK